MRFGVWTNRPGSVEPARKKLLYDVFRDADTPRREAAFGFALPLIGLKGWDEILAH